MNTNYKFLSIFFCFAFFHSAFGQTELEKANKLYDLNAYSQSISAFESLLAKDPKQISVYFKLAEACRKTNQNEKAMKYYSEALINDPSNPMVRIGYAKSLLENGLYTEAKNVAKSLERPEARQLVKKAEFAETKSSDPSFYQVAGFPFNTPKSDFGPSYGKNSLNWSSTRIDIKGKGLKPKTLQSMAGQINQLYKIGANNLPEYALSDLKNKVNFSNINYSPDGKWMVFTKNNFLEGVRQIPETGIQLSLFWVKLRANGEWEWFKPFPFNGTDFSTGYGSFSSDSKTLYFSSDRPGGRGGFDIFQCNLNGEVWGEPISMGPVINSPGNEITPFVTDNVLYFASDWHSGFGGYDIFRGEGRNYSSIFHMGTGINSSSDDYGYIYSESENKGYLTSSRPGGSGLEDIYVVSKTSDRVEIAVVNKKGEPVSKPNIDFTNCDSQPAIGDESGIFRFQALTKLDCKITVTKTGYQSKEAQIVTDGKGKNVKIIVELIQNINEFSGEILGTKTGLSLKDVKVILKKSGSLVQEVVSDNQGKYNLILEPFTDYSISYSLAGFQSLERSMRTSEIVNPNILGILGLKEEEKIVKATPKTSETNVPKSKTNEPVKKVETPIVKKESEIKANKDNTSAGSPFYVQLASVTTDKIPDISKYDDFAKKWGRIYLFPSDNEMQKILLGDFPTRQAAIIALEEIKKTGNPQAFVVDEITLSSSANIDAINKNAKRNDVEVVSNNPKPPTSKTKKLPPAVEEKPNEVEVKKPTSTKESPYRIRLGAFSIGNNLDKKDLGTLGNLVEESITVAGGKKLNLYFIEGLSSLPLAQSTLTKLKAKGFKDAFIQQNLNNNWIKL
jgi:cell division septation protein DedD